MAENVGRCAGIERVGDKVDENLRQAVATAHHEQVRSDIDRIGSVFLLHARLHDTERIVQRDGQRYRIGIAARLAREVEQPLGQARDAIGHVENGRDLGPHLVLVMPVEIFARHFGIGPDRRQRLVQFVADHGGHLSHGRQLGRLRQFEMRFAQVLLDLLPAFDFLMQMAVGLAHFGGTLFDRVLQLDAHPALQGKTLEIGGTARKEQQRKQGECECAARREPADERDILHRVFRRSRNAERPAVA